MAEAHIAGDNYASRRAAKKAGFVLAGPCTDSDGSPMLRYLSRIAEAAR